MRPGSPASTSPQRDVDVPLSALGERAVAALGRWFAALPEDERPNVVLSSPYRPRAQTHGRSSRRRRRLGRAPRRPSSTSGCARRSSACSTGSPRTASSRSHPDQAELRRLLGKFYHRPPGGESWCDVILRLRSALDTITLHHSGCRVLIVGHQVVVLCLRYLLENMTRQQILAIDAEGDVANCAVTEYGFDPGIGEQGQLCCSATISSRRCRGGGAPVTSEPDAMVAAR